MKWSSSAGTSGPLTPTGRQQQKVGPTLHHGKAWVLGVETSDHFHQVPLAQCVINYAGSANSVGWCGTRGSRFHVSMLQPRVLPCRSVRFAISVLLLLEEGCRECKREPLTARCAPTGKSDVRDVIRLARTVKPRSKHGLNHTMTTSFSLDHLPSPTHGRALRGTVVTGLFTSSTGVFRITEPAVSIQTHYSIISGRQAGPSW